MQRMKRMKRRRKTRILTIIIVRSSPTLTTITRLVITCKGGAGANNKTDYDISGSVLNDNDDVSE